MKGFFGLAVVWCLMCLILLSGQSGPTGVTGVSGVTGVTAGTGPVLGTPPVKDAAPAYQVLRIIDADGRDHFVLGGSIIRVERASGLERTVWVTLAGQGWNPVVAVTGETSAVAAAWAACAGLKVNPVAVGIPPAPPAGGAP